MNTVSRLIATAALSAASLSSHAELQARPGGMVYDTLQNITWLADLNYAKTSGYDADGLMDRSAASSWALNLVYGGFDDWRLPTLNRLDTSCSVVTQTPHFGYHCTGGELSHLFVADLGNEPGHTLLYQVGDTPEQVANLAMFSNAQVGIYWSATAWN